MKKHILYFLAIISVAFCATAFTKPISNQLFNNPDKKRAPQWFIYVGAVSPATSVSAKIATNYRVILASEPVIVLCGGSVSLCAIQAENDGTGKPLIAGQPIETAINNYFANPALPPATIKEKN